jgi:hypothetical protein
MNVTKDPKKSKQQTKKDQMLATGNWKEGPSGELFRVKKSVGLPTKDRLRELEGMNRPLTESEAREYASASFDPSSNPNMLFGLVAGAGFDPVGDAVMKLIGGAGRSIGKGVRAMKAPLKNSSLGSANKPSGGGGGDPLKATEKGVRFVKDFYNDPLIENHFSAMYSKNDRGIGALPKTFDRGKNPITPESANLDELGNNGALGAYYPGRDKTYLNEDFFASPKYDGMPKDELERIVSDVSAHETAHYADATLFDGLSETWGAGSAIRENLSKISHSAPPKQLIDYHGEELGDQYFRYISHPTEMTANAMSLRQSMEDVIFNDKHGVFKNVGDDESFSKLMIGDFSDLSPVQLKHLLSLAYNKSDTHVANTMRFVLKGPEGASSRKWTYGMVFSDPKLQKSISDWLKYALVVPVAGSAAVSAQKPDMAYGGKVRLLKNK